jgi:cell wall-associated NlpC family hydrolase
VQPSRHLGRGLVAGSLAFATAVGLLLASGETALAAPTNPGPPPTNPPQSRINAAQAASTEAATRVGQLNGQIAQAENELQTLKGKAEQAEQKAAYAAWQLQQANDKAAAAKKAVAKARQDVDAAHVEFVRYIQASYMSGDLDGTAGTMLTAQDPSQLLDQSSLARYQAEHHADAIGRLETATVVRSNAEAQAKTAVEQQKILTAKAKAAQQAAFAAVTVQQERTAALNESLSQTRTELVAWQSRLATLNGQREAFNTWLGQKRAYDAYQAELARQRAEAARRAAAAAAAAAARAQARHHHNGGGGGSSGGGSGSSSGGGGWSSGPSAPTGGSWTRGKGQRAVNRAMSQLGMPYAWAGGGVGGPSWGVCDSSNGAPNDCNVQGFDCSGLVLYAWGQNWAHYAATQYTQAGSYHPSLGNLRPGDLLFWSFNGRISGIHHVAIYKGNGLIIQAPESGDVVKVSSMYDPGPIFGATRPLT